MKYSYILALILLLLSSTAYSEPADCSYNGKTYVEGSVIGPLKCVDGKWVKK